MRPVSAEFGVTQAFGSLATAGVIGDLQGSQVQVLVAMYGNYQPFGHAGCDIGCPVGTPVHAIRAGTVIWCDWDINLPGDDSWGPSGYFARWAFYKAFGGRIILLQHDDGTYSDYCHLSAFQVTKGQRVNEGDLIALSGDSSGGQDGVLGPHLHTEWLSDLSYSTANGLIYGREDPEPHFGTTNPQEGTVTPEQMLELKRFVQACVNDSINKMWETEGVTQKLIQQIQAALGNGIVISKNQAEDVVAAVVARVPNAVLNAAVPLSGGASASIAWVLDNINAKPAVVAGGAAAPLDPQTIADVFVNHVDIQLTKK